MQQNTILFTGGSGLLGGEVQQLLPDAHYPTSSEFNVIDYEKMQAFIADKSIKLIVHAAAFTSPPMIDKDPKKAIDANIIGTGNVAKLCMENQLRLIYISTDYVFDGNKGLYKESDPVLPVNKYAWSKLGGECAVQLHGNALIIRTSFGPNEFPFPKAFVDQWTSRQSAKDMAAKIVNIATQTDENVTGIMHVGGPRRTVYEYAKSLDPNKEIGELSIQNMNFSVPKDTSLDCQRYEQLIK